MNLNNRDWHNGVDVQTSTGPPSGDPDSDSYEKDAKRLNDGEIWKIDVSDGYDLWYHRDSDPDNPQKPPVYQLGWSHIQNQGPGTVVDEDIT